MIKWTRPSPSVFAYCKRSKTGLWEGLEWCVHGQKWHQKTLIILWNQCEQHCLKFKYYTAVLLSLAISLCFNCVAISVALFILPNCCAYLGEDYGHMIEACDWNFILSWLVIFFLLLKLFIGVWYDIIIIIIIIMHPSTWFDFLNLVLLYTRDH